MELSNVHVHELCTVCDGTSTLASRSTCEHLRQGALKRWVNLNMDRLVFLLSAPGKSKK